MEYSAKAFQYSQEAHQVSGSSISGIEKTPRTAPAKRSKNKK
jgi:hypothetical protein